MNTNSPIYARNYGVFTEGSKLLNKVLGDNTGRTVSLRTSQGFKNVFKLESISDETAEDIVHVGMLLSLAFLFSKNRNALIVGLLIILILILFYQADK